MRFVLIVAFMLGSFVLAITQSQIPNQIGNYSNFEWMSEKWGGDSQPYDKVINGVNSAIDKKVNMNDVYVRALADAAANPKNPLLQFKVATILTYAGHDKLLDFVKLKTDYAHEELQAWRAICRAKSPGVRAYSRMRFVLEAESHLRMEHLNIAQRLYESDHNDGYSAHKYAFLLSLTKDNKKCRLGITVAKELLANKGSSVQTLKLLAMCYVSAWTLQKQAEDAKSAISYFERAIKASNDEYDKKLMRAHIEDLKKQARLG